MFNNYAMYDYEITESAEQAASGELKLSLPDLEFLLGRTVDLSNSQKLKDELIFGVFRKLLAAVDCDDDDEFEHIFDAVSRIQRSNIDDTLFALDILAENNISFTENRYYGGDRTTLRDWLLESVFSLGLLERMKRLGLDLNEALTDGKTPAYIIAEREFSEKCPWTDRDIEEELAGAVSFFSMESMEKLTAEGTSAVHAAVKNNHFKMLEAMIKAGINVNLTEDQPCVTGTTLLHKACRYGGIEAVRLLIEAGADDTLLDGNEESPAHAVLLCNYLTGSKSLGTEERTELLRELRNVDRTGKYGRTPMMAALDCDDYDIGNKLAPVFIEKGADVNHADNFGYTPLMLGGGMGTVKALVSAGADVNARNREGNTPLHFALERGGSQEAAYLIKKGADFNAANDEGVTPMQLVVEKGFEELLLLMGL